MKSSYVSDVVDLCNMNGKSVNESCDVCDFFCMDNGCDCAEDD